MEKRSESKSREKKLSWKLNSREKTLAIVVLAALLAGAWLPGRLIISTSPSLDHRIFFLTRAKGSITTGDYLVFKHKDTRFVRKGLDQENDRLVKKVGCCPGDMLSVDSKRTFYCSERELGTALQTDSKAALCRSLNFPEWCRTTAISWWGPKPRRF